MCKKRSFVLKYGPFKNSTKHNVIQCSQAAQNFSTKTTLKAFHFKTPAAQTSALTPGCRKNETRNPNRIGHPEWEQNGRTFTSSGLFDEHRMI
jgi:hypothetical protein